MQDVVLDLRIRLHVGLRGHLDVGAAHLVVVDARLEGAVRPGLCYHGADELLLRVVLLRREGLPQEVEEVTCSKTIIWKPSNRPAPEATGHIRPSLTS